MFGAWQQNEQPNEKLSGPVLAPLPVLGEDVLLFRWRKEPQNLVSFSACIEPSKPILHIEDLQFPHLPMT